MQQDYEQLQQESDEKDQLAGKQERDNVDVTTAFKRHAMFHSLVFQVAKYEKQHGFNPNPGDREMMMGRVRNAMNSGVERMKEQGISDEVANKHKADETDVAWMREAYDNADTDLWALPE